MEPEGSLRRLQVSATCPYTEPDVSFPLLRLYQRFSLSPRLFILFVTRPVSAVRSC